MNWKVGHETPVTRAQALTQNCLWLLWILLAFNKYSQWIPGSDTVVGPDAGGAQLGPHGTHSQMQLQCGRKQTIVCSVTDEMKEKHGEAWALGDRKGGL